MTLTDLGQQKMHMHHYKRRNGRLMSVALTHLVKTVWYEFSDLQRLGKVPTLPEHFSLSVTTGFFGGFPRVAQHCSIFRGHG